ncbi:MAG: YihY family inner membrane protein [Proteobacteria bacterium]|nr:YihY family inner membrane protein [Pseudomonadota bacterium]
MATTVQQKSNPTLEEGGAPSALAPREYTQPTCGVLWCLEELRFLARVLISSADRFYWDNGFSKAASLAYTTLFALVPLTMLAFGLLSSFALSNQHLPDVREFIFRQFVPQLEVVDEILRNLELFSTRIHEVSILAGAFIVITVILLLNSIEFVLNEVWQVYEARPISHRIGIFCTIIVVAPVLALSAYYFTSFRLQPLLQDYGFIPYLTQLYPIFVPALIDFAAFLLLYFYVPKAPVRFRSAVFGGLISAVLFGFAKVGFATYIESFAQYNKVYGAIASIPVFLFWVYLAWSIVLYGAEVSYQAQYLPRRGKLWKRAVLSSGDGRMLLAMQALVEVSHAFQQGKKLPNDLELAEQLGCSCVILKPALDAMERAGIVARGDSRTMPITLTRSPEKILLSEVREAVLQDSASLHYPEAMARMFSAFKVDGSSQELTLAQLVEQQRDKR